MEERTMLNAAPVATADAYEIPEDGFLQVGTLNNTAAGLVSHWKFDETTGSVARDSAGSNDGALINWGGAEAKWVSGRLGGALDFGDRNNYVRTKNVTLSQQYSFAFWIRLGQTEPNARIISPSGDDWIIDGTESERGIGFDSRNNQPGAQAPDRPMAGEWEHYVVTFDQVNSYGRVYRDGILADEGSASRAEPRGAWIIGHNQNPKFDGGGSWNGLMDDLRIYERVLTTEEIVALAGGTELVADQSVLLNDVDPDPDRLQAVLDTNVSNGTLRLNADGTFDYRPDKDFSGVDSFQYHVNDGTTDSEMVTVTITVTSVNDPPLAIDDQFTVRQGEELMISAASGVLANDSDAEGDALTIQSESDVSSGRLTLGVDGSLQYTPDAEFFGTDRFSYRVTDSQGASSVATVDIVVTPQGDEPFALDDQFQVDEDQTLVIDNQPMFSEASIAQAASDLVYVPQSDLLYATVPTSADNRRDTLTVIDPYTGEMVDRIAIGRNPKRVVVSDDGQMMYVVVEDRHAVQPLMVETRTLGDKFMMPEVGREFSRSVLDIDPIPGRPNAVVISRRYDNFSPIGGGVAIYENGVPLPDTLWGPLGNGGANILAVNEAGDRLYGYNNASTASDFWVMEIDGQGVRELEHYGWGSVLKNNVDRFSIVGDRLFADGGRIISLETLRDVGSFEGSRNFFVSAADNRLFSLSGRNRDHILRSYDLDTLELTASINLPGMRGETGSLRRFGDNGLAFRMDTDEIMLIRSDELLGITGRGPLRNDLNVDGFSTMLVDDVSNGTLVLNADGTFEYTPDENFAGQDSFRYQLGDGQKLSNVATVTITVDPQNDPPVAVGDSYVVPRDGRLDVDVRSGLLENDADIVEGDPLTAVLVTPPAHGTVALQPDGSFQFRADDTFVVTDQFTYKVSDGTATSEPVVVTLRLDTPMIDVGDHVLRANRAGQEISLYVTGGQSVAGMDLFVQVGDGGPELTDLGLPAGTRGPTITGVDVKTDTIFNGVPDVPTDLGSIPQVANWSISLAGGGSVAADGLLATVTVDTTGMFEGTWDLSLSELLPDHPFGPLNTSFAGELTQVINGSLTVVPARVVGRHLFYNDSAWDGDDPTAGPADDQAIAPDKTALLPGGNASFANYTSYGKGINGVIVDVMGLGDPAELTIDDFRFRTGRNNNPSSWQSAPSPVLTVRPNAGVDGSDRIALVWENNAIEQQWLEVTVKAGVSTLLPADDVFYFGNAIAETGNSPDNTLVTSIDVITARDNQRGPFDLASITDVYDFNRDRLVSSIDVILARDRQAGLLTALPLIRPPAQPVVAQGVAAIPLGDVNGDLAFDESDLIRVFQAGQYEDGRVGNSQWSTGDWNGDGEFNSDDLVLAFQAGHYTASATPLESQIAAAADWLFARDLKRRFR